jgi:hypothetical protein
MKYMLVLLILGLLMTSAAAQEPLTSDFQPPQGADLQSPNESPGHFRLLTATSEDGLTFTPTGNLITDQANVPDMVLDENGRLFLYFTGWQLGGRQNATAVAISDDLGETWVFKYLQLEGFDRAPLVDPDIVLLQDGTFRLFGTSAIGQKKLGIVYAEGTDGIHFKKIGTALEAPDSTVDSTTFFLGDQWHMLTLPARQGDQLYSTSSDGKTFTFQTSLKFESFFMANGVVVEGGFRLYGFSFSDAAFGSFFSVDGQSWEKESGVRLAYDPESPLEDQYIKDPAIQQLPDGTYLMVYVTRIPV